MKNELNKAAAVKINGVSIGKHGVRFAGRYTPAWYSHQTLIDGRECVTVYARRCKSLPKELGLVQNGSDMRTDYFESDKVRFFVGTPEFNAILPLAL